MRIDLEKEVNRLLKEASAEDLMLKDYERITGELFFLLGYSMGSLRKKEAEDSIP